MAEPFIPRTITVHLGTPSSNARNITVNFADYIKNVASSEIYPTWPENSLRANIYAITTYALNRIYTEYYRTQGYNFDITNSTQYDQSFVQGREIFGNISRIVDQIYTSYVVKSGQVQPYFTQYCSGRGTTCKGLSQWGTVSLANSGNTPYNILRYYYGNVGIRENVPVRSNVESYPGIPLKLGSGGEEVRTLQRELNRIRENYPAIPKIPTLSGIYTKETEDAVRAFQRIFGLAQDGITGRITWYRIKNIYNGVKRLNELQTEGLTTEEISRRFVTSLRQGSSGPQVRLIQYYLNFIGFFNNSLNSLSVDGIFGPSTTNAVKAFQRVFGLTQDGIVGRATWNKLQSVYDNILNDLPSQYKPFRSQIYPGYILTTGSRGEPVRQLQIFLNTVARYNSSVPSVSQDGVFGAGTQRSVRAYQALNGLAQTGNVDAALWERLRQDYVRYTE